MYKIYTKPNCPQCDQAKMFLKMKAEPFEAIDVMSSEDAFEFVVSEGFKSMPAVYKGTEKVGGLAELKKMF